MNRVNLFSGSKCRENPKIKTLFRTRAESSEIIVVFGFPKIVKLIYL